MSEEKPTGTQSIDRSVMLLKRMAMRGRTGWGLTDLASRCGLDKGTTHRILSALVRSRLVERDPVTRGYRLGPMLFELSLGRPDLFAMQKACDEPLARLAKRLRCITYVYLRSDTDVVVAAEAGHIPIKAMMIQIGTRRPLMQTAGGVAMLMAMPDDEAAQIIALGTSELAASGGASRVEAANRILQRSRSLGFGISEGHIAPHTTAIAVPLLDAAGRPFAALNVGGPSEQFPESHLAGVVALLKEEAAAIEMAVAGISPRAGVA